MSESQPYSPDPLDPLVDRPVVDVDGLPVGRVRAVFPDSFTIEYDGEPLEIFRAPRSAVATIDAARIQLTLARDGLERVALSSGA
ncbi:MAG: hypothetical protein IT337_04105 [Thermomicrobiales bacterium]|nr:hypothetical protein [Thermomicrobiales bacterium]